MATKKLQDPTFRILSMTICCKLCGEAMIGQTEYLEGEITNRDNAAVCMNPDCGQTVHFDWAYSEPTVEGNPFSIRRLPASPGADAVNHIWNSVGGVW